MGPGLSPHSAATQMLGKTGTGYMPLTPYNAQVMLGTTLASLA